MFEDLRGQVAVVTGGARGLGFSMATGLTAQGVGVALLDLSGNVVHSATTLATKSGQRVIGIPVDVTSEGDLKRAFDRVKFEMGSPSLLINAAGITTWEDSLEGTKESWSKVIDVNLTGTYLTCQAFARGCKADNHGGSIVNISSMSGSVVNVPQLQTSYNTSKAGVDMLTKSLAIEWGPLDIRVNAVAPGYFLSDMTRQFTDANPEMAERWRNMIPMGRMGESSDLDGLITLLCSSASSYLTGQSIIIDGGYTAI